MSHVVSYDTTVQRAAHAMGLTHFVAAALIDDYGRKGDDKANMAVRRLSDLTLAHELALAVLVEQLYRVDTTAPAASIAFDPNTLELVAGMVDGSVMTVDLVTGDLVSSVATAATTPVVRIGVRPDGLIVTASSGRIELVDRRTGPTGVVAEVSDRIAVMCRGKLSEARNVEDWDEHQLMVTATGYE